MKTKVGTEMTKEEEAYGAPMPVSHFPQHTTVVIPAQVDHSGTTCWYVFGILSTIFCCLPCGVIGLVHAMVAKHEGERGNNVGHKRRLYQAKCWTSWSIGLGLLFILLLTVWLILGSMYMRNERKNWVDDEGFSKDYDDFDKHDDGDKDDYYNDDNFDGQDAYGNDDGRGEHGDRGGPGERDGFGKPDGRGEYGNQGGWRSS